MGLCGAFDVVEKQTNEFCEKKFEFFFEFVETNVIFSQNFRKMEKQLVEDE